MGTTTVTGPRRRAGMRALLGLVVSVGLLAAACGDDDDDTGAGTSAVASSTAASGTDSAATTAASGDDVDPAGVLRLPHDLTTAGGVMLDPVALNTPTDFWIHAMIYDTLLRQLADGSYEPGLATEATITDPSTIEITLREGLTFQDGTPLDAEAVKFSIERNAAANKPQTFRTAELSQIDSITVESETSLTIHLKSPTAGSFYNLLAHGETTVVSPTAVNSGVDLNAEPVGAGPFRVVSFTPETSIVMERWDGYYKADEIRLAGVEIIQTGDVTATLNALRSGTVDAAPLSHDLLGEIEGADGIVTVEERSPDNVLWLSLQCARNPAFQDVRVRQALNFATDKEALNEALYGGAGEPMSQFWSSDTPYYNPDIEMYEHDPARAQQLLGEAGFPNLEVSIAVPPTATAITRFAELLQAQWAQAGINVTLEPTNNTIQDYYIDKKMDSYPTAQTRSWTDKITRNFVPGSVGNTCDPQSEEFTALVSELRATDPNDPAAADVWHEIAAFLSEGAYGVWGVMGTVANAYNEDRIGDIAWVPSQLGVRFPDVQRVYIKA